MYIKKEATKDLEKELVSNDEVEMVKIKNLFISMKQGNQQADIDLQTIFSKVASEFKFLPEYDDRVIYYEELIDWLEGESK